ncbi:MAG: plasmid mobilization relaxosome protein MobC [Porphyromonas sp.]|nr:MAG: plasmid mobilization relaxosome protein MobC [Porphyromonas sp.]
MENRTEKQQGNKIKRLEIRLSEQEFQHIKKHSKGYSSMSSFVLDAVKNHDPRRGKNRIDTMIKFSELMENSDVSLSRLGNNINQIAHVINRKIMANWGANFALDEDILMRVEDARFLLEKILIELRKISNSR